MGLQFFFQLRLIKKKLYFKHKPKTFLLQFVLCMKTVITQNTNNGCWHLPCVTYVQLDAKFHHTENFLWQPYNLMVK